MGINGAALASCLATLYQIVMLVAYVFYSGQARIVFGRPSRAALQGWAEFARLAYPSCIMKCAESSGFFAMTWLVSYGYRMVMTFKLLARRWCHRFLIDRPAPRSPEAVAMRGNDVAAEEQW